MRVAQRTAIRRTAHGYMVVRLAGRVIVGAVYGGRNMDTAREIEAALRRNMGLPALSAARAQR